MTQKNLNKSEVSVGIVTYNNSATIAETVTSLLSAAARYNGKVTIHIRDNGSKDNTLKVIREIAPTRSQLKIHEGGNNVGFGRGHNEIMKWTRAETHIICNPDIIVPINFFERCSSFMSTHLDVGLMSPRMTWADGTLQHSNRRQPTILDLLLRRFAPQLIRTIFKERMDRYAMVDVGYENVIDVPFASGAIMVCRRSALDAVGGFDERYFLYFEDADLTRMLQSKLWRTVFNPKITVIHGWQRASHHNLRMTFVMVASGIRFFLKWGIRFK